MQIHPRSGPSQSRQGSGPVVQCHLRLKMSVVVSDPHYLGTEAAISAGPLSSVLADMRKTYRLSAVSDIQQPYCCRLRMRTPVIVPGHTKPKGSFASKGRPAHRPDLERPQLRTFLLTSSKTV